MPANPVLAEQTRGNTTENIHRGAIALIDAAGRVIASAGDIDRRIFPRSAVKSMQALAMLTSDAPRRFSITDEEIALAAASHHGEDVHLATVSGLLDRIGLDADALECGAHLPTNAKAREALRAAGSKPLSLHNNCSGKHAGMLALARDLGVPSAGYVSIDHVVQKRVRAAIEAVIGQELTLDACGTDGCSIPTYAAPLRAFARGFARMATGQGLPYDLADASRRVFDAATGHPRLVAGTGAFDTVLMEAFGGRLMQKTGAEAVQCGAIRDLGLGYAIKCDDGNMAASQAMLAALLLRHANPDAIQRDLLEAWATQPIRNVRGLVVGEMRAIRI